MTWIPNVFVLLFAMKIAHCYCPKIYDVEGCICNPTGSKPLRLLYKCHGNSFLETLSNLPNITLEFEYTAYEDTVLFGAANFTRLTELRHLVILSADGRDRKLILLPNQTDVLRPLEKLIVLQINVMWELNYPMPELLKPLSSLRRLDLSNTKRVNITSLISTLSGLKRNRQLTGLKLWNIQTLEFASSMGQLYVNLSQLLEPLSNHKLSVINLGYNALQGLHPGFNMFAKNLMFLSLENNMLMHIFESSLFMDIITHPRLKGIKLGYQGFGVVDGQFDHGGPQACSSSMSFNRKNTNRNVFSKMYAERTPVYDGCLSAMQADLCLVYDDVCNETRHQIMEANDTCLLTKKLMPKYFNDIPCEVIPPLREMLDEHCASCFVIPTVGSLKQFYISYLNIYDDVYISPILYTKPLCFHSRNNFNLIDVRRNNDYSYKNIANLIQADIRGLEKVTVLKIGRIGLNEVSSNLGRNFPNLESIDLSQNDLTFENQSAQIFEGMKNLTYLDMSFNKIQSLEPNMFRDLHSLKTLNLSHNSLYKFEAIICNISALRNLDLRNNLLETLPTWLINSLNDIAPISEKSVHVYLTNNNFFCICENKDFVEWVLVRRHSRIDLVDVDEIFCTNKYSRKIQLLSLTSGDMRDMCRGQNYYIYLSIGISVPASFLFFAICLCLYHKRWWFRYQVFLSRQLWRKYQDRAENEVNYRYDVFVSYNERDHYWVDYVLCPTLEEEHGIRLCLHLRDFTFGGLIIDQIIESIENSRRTMLILSPNFLASTWCHFEMQMAQNKLFSKGKDVLLLVLLKPLPKVGVSKMLKTLLETKTYIEWSEDEYGQKLFWAKLIQAVKAPALEPYDVAIEDDTIDDEQRNLIE